MSVWGGFSDEELKRLNGLKSDNQARNQLKEVSLKRQNYRKIQKPIKTSNKVSQDIPSQQKLSLQNQSLTTLGSEKDTNLNSYKNQGEDAESKFSSTGTGVQSNQRCFNEEKHDCNSMTTDKSNNIEDVKFLTDESTILEKGLQSLEKFRERQKEVEELNKKRKAMLASAIKEKEKKANAETKKLFQIKKELEQLDLLVVSDISIIRDKIEEASRTYLSAQKRYELAEKEFIEAKVDLHKKQEYKEQLTEHLYTVIHQNEMRKAAKLHALMSKLEMEEKDIAENECSLTIPPMVILEQPHLSKSKCLGSKTLNSCKSYSIEDSVEKSVIGEEEKNPNIVESIATVEIIANVESIANVEEQLQLSAS